MKKNKIIICTTSMLLAGVATFSILYFTKGYHEDNHKNNHEDIHEDINNKRKNNVSKEIKRDDIYSFGATEDGELPTPPIELTKLILPVEQRIQETSYYCVPAVLQMVLNFKNISIPQEQLAMEMNTSSKTGTEYIDLARVANKYLFDNENVGDNDPGYHVQTIERNDSNPQIAIDFKERVKTNIKNNDPTFVAIDVNVLYPQLNSANHMILLVGYATYANTDNIAYYYYIDPSYAVQDSTNGGLKIVTEEELIKAIIQNVEPAYVW